MSEYIDTSDPRDMVAEIRRLRAELAEAREIADAVERLCPSKEAILEIVHEHGSWFVHNTEGTDGHYFSTNAGQGPTLLAALRAALAAKEAGDGR